MNPYTSLWTGVAPGDGPQEFHLVLLDNGRTQVLADQIGRQTLNCIRCSACLNICPVYERTGGHAYQSVYPGPIGAILTPQLVGVDVAGELPYASSLCGACYEVCPVKINIPEVLVHMRGKVVRAKQRSLLGQLDPENLGMQALQRVAELEPPLTALEDCLGGLGKALCSNDPQAIEAQAGELHRALARAVGQFSRAAREGGVPTVLRHRLALASGQVAAQREALARATASLDRAIDVLIPRMAPSQLYSAAGANDRQGLPGGGLLA